MENHIYPLHQNGHEEITHEKAGND